MLLHHPVSALAAAPAASVQAPKVKTFNIIMPSGKRILLEAASTATVLGSVPALQPGGSLWFDASGEAEQLVTADTIFDHLPAVLTCKAAAGGSAGAGGGPSAGERAGDIVTRQHPAASSYAADITIVPGPGQEPFKIAATVLKPNIVVTFCHPMCNKGEASPYWPPDIGACVMVHVNDNTQGHRKPVSCEVIGHHKAMDLVALKPNETLSAPDLDTTLRAGQEYFMLGQSAQACADRSSLSHGTLSVTTPDDLAHIRGDMESGRGDSGAPVFAVASGKLMGVCVGNDDIAKKAVFVPAALAMNFAMQCL